MKSTDDAKSTQKLTRPSPRKGPAQSPFAGKELLPNPTYSLFREIVTRNPQKAAETMRDAPECVGFAARMLSDADAGVSIEAGAALLCAAERGMDLSSAINTLKQTILHDESDQVRLSVAKIFHKLASNGHDISNAIVVLGSAYERDSYENVRLTAENALIAAGHPPE